MAPTRSHSPFSVQSRDTSNESGSLPPSPRLIAVSPIKPFRTQGWQRFVKKFYRGTIAQHNCSSREAMRIMADVWRVSEYNPANCKKEAKDGKDDSDSP